MDYFGFRILPEPIRVASKNAFSKNKKVLLIIFRCREEIDISSRLHFIDIGKRSISLVGLKIKQEKKNNDYFFQSSRTSSRLKLPSINTNQSSKISKLYSI